MENKKYKGLNGLRTIACIGIVMMHMSSPLNNIYVLPEIMSNILRNFNDFVFLFMMISAFGICCGYYDKMLSGNINLVEFYKKRYVRVLPFFAFFVLIDVVVDFSKETIIEGLTDITLIYGLFPNDIRVIGVGWFLGVIFVFYMLFPFFCVLIENEKRAWMVFAVSLVLNYFMYGYYNVGGRNFVYCLCYFCAGGLLFIYRKQVSKINPIFCSALIVVSLLVYYKFRSVYTIIIAYILLMVFAITSVGEEILSNKFMDFISEISMEIYLSHMFVFRITEKLGLNYMIGNGIGQYVVETIIVLVGTVVLATIVKRTFKTIIKLANNPDK